VVAYSELVGEPMIKQQQQSTVKLSLQSETLCLANLTSAYRRSEHVGIEAVVVAELKLRDIERHIFCAHLVERADHAALEDRPKSLNRVRVDSTDDVLLAVMVNGAVRVCLAQFSIAVPCVGCEQANFVGTNLVHKLDCGIGGHAFQNAGDHIALALNGADDWRLAGSSAASHAMVFLIPMPIGVLAADVSFVNLNNAAQLDLRLDERGANFVGHVERGFIGAEAHLALNLKAGNSLFARQHQMDDFEPLAEWLVRVFEDRPSDDGKAVASIAPRGALRALPMPLARRQVIDGGVAATRTDNALRPTAGHQVSLARILVTDWETSLKLGLGHLVNWLRALRTFCHGGYPLNLSVGGYCHG
jgi:hypothetical protein